MAENVLDLARWFVVSTSTEFKELVLQLSSGEGDAAFRGRLALGPGPFGPDLPDPEAAASQIAPGAKVRSSDVAVDGTLTVAIDGLGEMTVPPNEDFEAWDLSRSDGLWVICTPGGAIATFPPRR